MRAHTRSVVAHGASRRRRTIEGLAIAVALGSIAACGSGDTGLRLSSATTLSAATAVGTAPMFAVSPSGTQAVAWVSAPGGGTDGRLYIVVGGSPPVEIRDSLGPIEAHGEAPPKLAYGPDGALYAVYIVGKVVPGERFPLSAVRLVRSTDGGRTWDAPVTVTHGAVFGSHSFHALYVASDGTVYVSWLGKPEGDSSAAPPAHMVMQMSGGGMTHETSAAWITHSTDGGRTWTVPVRVDSGESCPCCRTAIVTAANGTVYMAWRHVFPGSVRDIVVARSDDHGATWSAPVRVHADDWQFDACPHAGPAITLDSTGTLHVAWWTGKEGAAGVFYARSTDGARSFGAPVALGVAQYSRPAHVQMATAAHDRVIVAWDDGTRDLPRVLVRVSDDDGRHFHDAATLSAAGRAATFPVLAVSGTSLAVAWSEESAAAHNAPRPAHHDRTTPQGLDPVGQAEVMVRRAVLE